MYVKAESDASIDWRVVENNLGHPYGVANFRTHDGLKLTVQVQQVKALKFALICYVDGFFRGEWMRVEHPYAQRFFEVKTKRLVPKAKAEATCKALLKAFSQKEARKLSGLESTFPVVGFFTSPKALCAKLKKGPGLRLWQETDQQPAAQAATS